MSLLDYLPLPLSGVVCRCGCLIVRQLVGSWVVPRQGPGEPATARFPL